jgi:cell division control protein 6
MREMTTQAHLALSAIAVLEKAGDTPVRTKPVYGVYQNIADLVDADKLVQRRTRDHLLELDMQGIIDAQKKAGGSVGGPAWHFELQVNDDVVIDVLKDVSRLESIDFDNIGSNRASRLGEYS